MNESVLYRKYRPHKFEDVIGQDHIIKPLAGSIKEGKISHAYLFSGSRGTGKTSVARILAKELGISGNDLYEIDAASNTSVEDIRALNDSVNVMPFESPYKAYLLDEVHMLSKSAFNALLKTLEEPPRHVIFILATTEMGKLPETVISRCQTFNFKKPGQNILKELVLGVAKKEGYVLDPSSAELVAILGDGSFRDTLGILQKVISSSLEKKIKIEEVEKITGAPKSLLVNEVVRSIAEKNLERGIKAVNSASKENVDMKLFAKLILLKLRAVLLMRFSGDVGQAIREEMSDADFEFLQGLAKNSGLNVNSSVIVEMIDAEYMTGRSSVPELPLEIALAKLLDK